MREKKTTKKSDPASNISDNKKRMLNALEDSLGVVTAAARAAKIDRSTHYDWINVNSPRYDADYHRSYLEIADIALDEVESELFNQIRDGNTTATIFYLKTKGKRRGYVERSEIDINPGDPDLSEMSTDDIKTYIENLDNLNAGAEE